MMQLLNKLYKPMTNNIFKGITFLREKGKNNTLPFLDIHISRRNNGKLEALFYQKITNSNQETPIT